MMSSYCNGNLWDNDDSMYKLDGINILCSRLTRVSSVVLVLKKGAGL